MLYCSIILLSFLAVAARPPNDSSRLHRLGSLSPYHKAPVPEGVDESLPSNCKVEQVMYLSRHGSRYPSHEAPIIRGMSDAVAKAKEYLTQVSLPEELQFLTGYASNLGEESLVEMGRQQLFEHGVAFREKYPGFSFDRMECSDVERVIESADSFGRGYFGPAWKNISSSMISPIPTNNVTASRITPWHACRAHNHDKSDKDSAEWERVYLPPITRRINSLVPGLNFTETNTAGALAACGYDYAAHAESPWCNVFTDEEIGQYEYNIDLVMSASWGPRLPNNLGAVMGSLYVNTLIDRFSSSDSKPVYVEFGHDVTISLTLTALGLIKDVPPISTTTMSPNRKYRSSNQIPFAAQMVFEKFTCSESFEGPQIRLTLNDSPFPLFDCAQSPDDARYGSCSFANFVQANKASTSITYGDETWVGSCGPVA